MEEKPHFLVTAGSTREKIDQVRDWGNIFTGKTGLDIALALLDLGDVTLLTSNGAHAAEFDGYSGNAGMLGIESFQTHAELRELLAERVTAGRVDAVLMTAAVSDYKPTGAYKVLSVEKVAGGSEEHSQERWIVENVQAEKIRSTHERIAIVGEATPKLIDLFRAEWAYKGLLIKFKLEVGLSEAQLIAVAQASRVASQADWIVANTLSMVGGTHPGAYIIGPKSCERVDRALLAARLRDLIAMEVVRGDKTEKR